MVIARACRSWTVGLAVFALLLKAAVPLLAGAAARLQGVPVANICDVYGVRTIPTGHFAADPHAGHAGHAAHAGHIAHDGHDAPADPGSHAAAGDAATHCALLALGASAAGHPAPAPVIDRGDPPGTARPAPERPGRDATALWVARLKHGPPASA